MRIYHKLRVTRYTEGPASLHRLIVTSFQPKSRAIHLYTHTVDKSRYVIHKRAYKKT